MIPCKTADAKIPRPCTRLLRLVMVLALSSLALTACGKDEEQAGTSGSASQLLSYAPSSTPYLAGNLEPTPDEVIDSFLKRLEPVTATLQTELEKLKTELESNSQQLDSDDRLALALAREFDGKLNRAGLESLGFDLTAEMVLYGFNAYPVFRSSVSDATALRATVQRILDNAEISAQPIDFQGKPYWKVSEEGTDDPDTRAPHAFYIAILDDHLVAALYPESAEAQLLPHLLGFEKPAGSDAAQRLAKLNDQYEFTPYGTGILDFQMLADEFSNPESLLSRTLAASGKDLSAARDPVCQTEIRAIISNTPRLVAGTTELTANAYGGQYVLETEKTIAQQLIALVSDVPAVAETSARMLEFSVGLKVGGVRDFLRTKMEAITAAPYQCAAMQDLNTQAADALAQLNQPMPPLVNNFLGLRLSLDQLNMDPASVPTAEGLVAVHVDQPEMVVGMAQMFVPDLAELKLVKGEPPVALPASMIPVPDVQAFAALAETSIGIGLGAESESALVPYLEMKSKGDGSFLSVNYDSAAFMEWAETMDTDAGEDALSDTSEGYDPETGEPLDESGVEESAEESAASHEMPEAMKQAFKAMAGRSEFRMRFTPDGLVVDSRMTFK